MSRISPFKAIIVAALSAAAMLLGTSAAFAQAAPGYNVPTDLPASPLTFSGQTATEWTQKMMLFEEFGTKAVPGSTCPSCQPLPAPATCNESASGLDAFLTQPLWPAATRVANTSLQNPWASKVSSCLSIPMGTSATEGRPSGEWFAHQRWTEFTPKVYFKSAQAAARDNGGLRNAQQRHHWAVGEFKSTGLYYYGGTNTGVSVKFHPNLPAQTGNSVWTFDGTMPPKLLMARYGEPVLFRHYNALPIDGSNAGFGKNTLTTHEHNGHNPAESDGFAAAFFFPGQYYDYHWPMVLAGNDTINTGATDPFAAMPNGAGGTTRIKGDWHETMSTHWFHDHMLDFTAQNVYKGNAAMMNYYSAIDRGKEGLQCRMSPDGATYTPTNPNLCLPSGTSLDWGNRDYDVNLMIADKAWDAQGQLAFSPLNNDGFLGDRVLVNWSYKPYLDVRARRYRFRILDGAVSRYFKLAIVTEAGAPVPFYMVANDGNIMENPVLFANGTLPQMGIAERYDIVVDFAGRAGQNLYLVNLLEHQNGAEPFLEVSIATAISPTYLGDPAVGKIMQFRVVAATAADTSMNPANFVVGNPNGAKMIEVLPLNTAGARERTFQFSKNNGTDAHPWTIATDGGRGFDMDPHRISANPTKGTVEIWHLRGGSGWAHPIHIHFEEGRILSRGGNAPPAWEVGARKDIYRLHASPDATNSVDLAIQFREFMGTYMEHCHNTQHEDNAMLMRWDIKNPGAAVSIPTPIQTWQGTLYERSFGL